MLPQTLSSACLLIFALLMLMMTNASDCALLQPHQSGEKTAADDSSSINGKGQSEQILLISKKNVPLQGMNSNAATADEPTGSDELPMYGLDQPVASKLRLARPSTSTLSKYFGQPQAFFLPPAPHMLMLHSLNGYGQAVLDTSSSAHHLDADADADEEANQLRKQLQHLRLLTSSSWPNVVKPSLPFLHSSGAFSAPARHRQLLLLQSMLLRPKSKKALSLFAHWRPKVISSNSSSGGGVGGSGSSNRAKFGVRFGSRRAVGGSGGGSISGSSDELLPKMLSSVNVRGRPLGQPLRWG